jgi:hypothetical protein
MRYTVYSHPCLRQWVGDLAQGRWMRGLADGANAWDLSTFTVEQFVDTTWHIIPGEDIGAAHVKAAWERDRRQFEWSTEYFKRMLEKNDLTVRVEGPTATIGVITETTFATSCPAAQRVIVQQHRLEVLPIEVHWLVPVTPTDETIPIFEADVVVRDGGQSPSADQRHVFIVGRLDIPILNGPHDRIVDTLRKAKNLARKVAVGLEARDVQIGKERAEELRLEEERALLPPIELAREEQDAILDAF